jgi:alkaline phosphatase
MLRRWSPSHRLITASFVTVATVLSASTSSAGAAGAVEPTAHQDRPSRSVIFVNGDGMAAAQREAGGLSIAGLDGELEMDKLPVSGLLTTDSREPDTVVTDSAAAATAWATGQKTYNGAI